MNDSCSDLFGFTGDSLEEGLTRFASGVMAPAIWEGYRRAGVPLCIAATDVSAPALARACDYVAQGGSLLVDSGAFVFRGRAHAMPWDRVLRVYHKIAAAATQYVHFMLPDVVGSQNASLNALSRWGDAIRAAIGDHHYALLPLQTGALSPSRFAAEAMAKYQGRIDGVAIPSNAAAFPTKDLNQLNSLPVAIPHRVHFLGISRNSQGLRERLFRLNEVWPDAVVSCDACEHRSAVGQGKPITEMRKTILAERWETRLEDWDETEEPTDAGIERLRQQFPDMDPEDLDALWCSQLGHWHSLQALEKRHQQIAGPEATTEAIYHFANRDR